MAAPGSECPVAEPAGGGADAVSRDLAGFVVASRWNDIAPDVRRQAVSALLNGFGTALGGAQDDAVLRLVETFRAFSGAATSTVIGHPARVDMPTAAFLNAAAMNVFDFDDTHRGTIIHPTAPVAAAVLALAEARGLDGAAVLHAFVLGTEIECRIGNAISPGHYDRGWHITATCGVFGAAVAVGKLIGLDDRQMLWAIGNASAQASGLVETLGSMSKSVGVGNAARNGLLAALMAQNGIEGPLRPLEGPRGFLRVTADAADVFALIDGLGESWELIRDDFKPYPCGVVLNPVIDACLTAYRDGAIDTARVDHIIVTGGPLLKARADRPAVTTGREAQVSAQHAVAVSLLSGRAGVAEFSDRAVSEPAVLALRARVRPVEIDAGMPIESARVEFVMADGHRHIVSIATANGSADKPLSRRDLERKFCELAAYGCPTLEQQPLIDRLWGIEHAADIADVMAAARPAAKNTR